MIYFSSKLMYILYEIINSYDISYSMIPIQTKGIFSIIGSCCNQLCLFSLFVFSNLSVYIISYLKHTNPSLRLEHGYFLGPLCTFTMNCCNFLGGVVDNTFGVHMYQSLFNSIVQLLLDQVSLS